MEMTPREKAMDFIVALAGNETCSFQTFDDSSQKRPGLTRVLHGGFRTCYHTLIDLNVRGAGIFVTINATDGKGRGTENITSLRALFVDGDDIPLPAKWRLEPSIVTQ